MTRFCTANRIHADIHAPQESSMSTCRLYSPSSADRLVRSNGAVATRHAPTRVATAVALIGLLVVSGCASNPTMSSASASHDSSNQLDGSAGTAESSPSDGETMLDEPAPDLSSAGDVRITSGDGATGVVAGFKVGTPTTGADGAPPTEALEACNANYSTTIATSAFVPATISLKYVKGTLPIDVTIIPRAMVGLSAVMAVEINGSWRCDNVTLKFDPGETNVLPAYVIDQVLGNAHPELTSQDKNRMYFRTADSVLADADTFHQHYESSGRGAFCADKLPGEIFMFAVQGECTNRL